MEQYRKILVAIMALLVLSVVIAIVDISMTMQEGGGKTFGMRKPGIGPGVGIVRVEGPIHMMSVQGLFAMPSGAETIIDRLTEMEENRSIKAVVLKINSPGGTVVATQEIYQKLWKLRKKNIVLVASMGEVAASGGYYIASPCNFIVANHGTITGSIGVIARAPNVKGLFDKIGVKMNVIKSGKFKDSLSPFSAIDPAEGQFLQNIITSSHRKFIKDVALGRNLNQSEIAPYADGRIFDGETAKSYNLVDMVGTFDDALAKAKELAKLPDDAPVYDEVRSPLRQFMMNMESALTGVRRLEETVSTGGQFNLEYRYGM